MRQMRSCRCPQNWREEVDEGHQHDRHDNPAKYEPLRAWDRALRRRFGVPAETEGVLVTDVDPLGAAIEKGIRPGDVIVEVAQRPVSTPADVERIVLSEEKGGRRSVLLRMSSAGDIRFVALRLGGE